MTVVSDCRDGQLLADVASSGSQASFAELVRRHGAMVLNLCRRLLTHEQDAEDAAQAVFLVLWKKAGTLAGRASAAGWLHYVARNVCRNARRARDVRDKREREAVERNKRPGSQDSWVEIKDVLDEELNRLPEKYRLAIILFHLEGRSLEEMAALLSTTPSTVGTQLSRARERLRARLARRGIAIGVGALAVSLTAQAGTAVVPVSFVTATAQAASLFAAGKVTAGGVLSPKAAALAKGVLNMLTMVKLKLAATAVAAAALIVGGSVVMLQLAARAPAPPTNNDRQGASNAQRVDDAPKEDKETIQGTWKVVSIEDGGEKRDSGDKKVIFGKDTLTFKEGERRLGEATYELDATKKPKWIDVTQRDNKMLGIYKLDGDNLKVCYNEVPGGERSTEFVSKSGTPNDVLMILQRETVK